MKLSRIARLIKIIGLLQSGRPLNTADLSGLCDVSRRTIFRDLIALREAGVPLVFDEARELYSIPGQFFLPPTNFNAAEALAVLVLCHQLGNDRVPFLSSARSAAMKLENSLPEKLREYLRRVSPSLAIRMTPMNSHPGKQSVYDALVGALADRQAVRVEYGSFHERKNICTKLNPYQLLFQNHSWYVIGRSSLHRSVRTFNLSRIVEIHSLEEAYEIPRGFSMKRYLRNAWRLIPEPGPDHFVRIRFSPKVAGNVAEVSWHATQRVRWNEDGSLQFEATVSGLEEISWWVLGYGDQAEVLEPEPLREIIAKRVGNMAKAYGLLG